MFAARVKKQIELKDDEGKTGFVTIRKLSAKSLDKCREQKQLAGITVTSKLPSEVIKAFRESGPPVVDLTKVKTPAEERQDLYDTFDRDATLVAGVESWTFDVPLQRGLDELDEETALLLFHEIVDLSYPPAEVVAGKEKNV